uniref:Serpentine Receptor, class H n=2 Tax=Caenorhabditis tropicalis TaxID=1561998 RepID=A0A1I7UBL4_9PELO
MKSVKRSMFNLHFWGMASDIGTGILTQPFICTPTYSGLILGVLKFLPASIPTYLSCTAFMTLVEVPDQTYGREQLFKQFPQFLQYDSPETPIYVLLWDLEEWLLLLQRILMIFITTQGLTFVFLISYEMRQATRQMTLSETSLRLQKEFMRAVKLQILIPIILILIPSVSLAALGTNRTNIQGANNLIFMTISTHGAISTLAMLYLHKPYRDYCSSHFCVAVRPVDNAVSVT